jgi:putative membrane protein
MPDDIKQELALERTDLALARTLFAKQRTFAAWVRTGLSSMSVGFGIVKLLPDVEPRWLVVTMGCVMIVVGGFMQVVGFGGYYRALKGLEGAGIKGSPPWMLAVIAGGLLLCAIIMLVLVALA